LEKVLGALNVTSIASIPKKNDSRALDDYRPISLCNSLYKFITKILANKLKIIFLGFISKKQFGFLYNRQSHDVVGITQEGLHSIKEKKSNFGYEN